MAIAYRGKRCTAVVLASPVGRARRAYSTDRMRGERSTYPLLGLLAVALGGAALGGCPAVETPVIDPSEGRTFSGAVTAAAGGTVATPGDTLTVEVPPSALAADTTVTIAVAPAASGSATSVYEIGPDGTSFALPVTLALRFDQEPAAGQRVALAWMDGGTWRTIPGSRLVGGRIVGATRHFSRFAGLRVDASVPVYPWPEGQGDESSMTYWTWTDATTNLTWQVPSAVHVMNWQEALDYCSSLYLDGGGWRLPSIDELRSLIRGCPGTATGGACAVTSDCSEMWSCFSNVCNGCADGGCNWDPALFYEGESDCVPPYWSSSTYHAVVPGTGMPTPEDGLWAWTVSFAGGLVGFDEKTGTQGQGDIRVRCVR